MNLMPPGQQPVPPSGNKWIQATTRDPQHSQRYAQRWRDIVASGQDIDGEARLIDAMADRNSRILDVGCGTGRTGGYLATRGHQVVGVDLDPHLIQVARDDFPDSSWHVGDIENLHDSLDDTAREAIQQPFDLAVSAGNVMGFLSEEGRRPALHAIHDALADGGRAVIGYGAGRGWDFTDFLEAAAQVGFSIDGTYSTWQLDPFEAASSEFLVAMLRH